jgi:predicted nuclease of predicted toxin-antitoxin system
MRLLVDENLSNRVALRLTAGGQDAVHVTDVGLGNTDDHVILDWAAVHDRTIVTSDTDFGALLAVAGAMRPSVVLLRSSDHLTPDQQADLLQAALPLVDADVTNGAVVSLTPERIRIRRLPIDQA